ncbi:MAG: hypothetical protein WCC64_16605, partial [Aliidongia sp.]
MMLFAFYCAVSSRATKPNKSSGATPIGHKLNPHAHKASRLQLSPFAILYCPVPSKLSGAGLSTVA